MPRFTRALLLLTTLSLLIVPMGNGVNAGAQEDGDDGTGKIVGFVAGDATTCTTGTTLNNIPVTISHERCVGGVFNINNLDIVATRDLSSPSRLQIVICRGGPVMVPFSIRGNTIEGRGRIGDVHIPLDGIVIDTTGVRGAPPGPPDDCRLRIDGAFHHIGNVIVGRLRLDVHIDDPGNTGREFRHGYCARFVSIIGFGGIIEGSTCDHANDSDQDGTHGRSPFDDIDPLHHDECTAPPDPAGVQCLLGL